MKKTLMVLFCMIFAMSFLTLTGYRCKSTGSLDELRQDGRPVYRGR